MHKLIEIYLHLSGINTSIGSIIFDIIQNKWPPERASHTSLYIYRLCWCVASRRRPKRAPAKLPTATRRPTFKFVPLMEAMAAAAPIFNFYNCAQQHRTSDCRKKKVGRCTLHIMLVQNSHQPRSKFVLEATSQRRISISCWWLPRPNTLRLWAMEYANVKTASHIEIKAGIKGQILIFLMFHVHFILHVLGAWAAWA